jgi:Tfp pilus assembly protein PilN
MIRINLIAEKKSGAAKVAKKDASSPNDIQENILLLGGILIAGAVSFILYQNAQSNLKAANEQRNRLQAEYNDLKKYEQIKEDYEIRKELLNEKIMKISELKDNREGPVKLMEDVANVLPESVWLGGIDQGYSQNLVKPTGKGRQAFKPYSTNLGDQNLVRVSGYARTTDAITTFARKILSMDSRYEQTDLNSIDKLSEGYHVFQIYFKVKRSTLSDDANTINQP